MEVSVESALSSRFIELILAAVAAGNNIFARPKVGIAPLVVKRYGRRNREIT
jgi:hypothetical protein